MSEECESCEASGPHPESRHLKLSLSPCLERSSSLEDSQAMSIPTDLLGCKKKGDGKRPDSALDVVAESAAQGCANGHQILVLSRKDV